MEKPKEGCVSPAKGPINETVEEETVVEMSQTEETKMNAQVGKPAPDFEANAYMDGGFTSVKLSDYKGKWVVVCFYPGDFTFV